MEHSALTQLRSCLVTSLAPDHESQLPKYLGSARVCLGSPSIIAAADAQIVNRVRVRLSALLQSKNTEIRRCGAELVYTLVQSDWDSLASHGVTWVKLLLTILEKRQETFDTLNATILALSQIFKLVHGKPTLTRELATPNIPSYAGLLLALSVSASGALDRRLLSITLPAIYEIMTAYSTTFRPFATKLMNNIVQPIFNLSCQAGNNFNRQTELICRKIYASKYRLAPKSQQYEWKVSILQVVGELHKAIDKTFDVVIEEATYANVSTGWETSVDIESPFHGILRLEFLIRLLETFFNTATSTRVQVPVAQIVEVVDRLLSIDPEIIEFRPTVGRVERDFITSALPVLHAAIYGFLTTFVKTAGQIIIPHVDVLVSHLSTIPVTRYALHNIPIYKFVSALLSVVQFATPSLHTDIAHIVELALVNISPQQTVSRDLPDFSSHPQKFVTQASPEVIGPALEFLVTVVACVPDLPATTRSSIDRFAVLRSEIGSREEKLLLESVLQPGSNIRWSIMPMAANRLPSNHMLGGLIHPRFPPMPVRREDMMAAMTASDLLLMAQGVNNESARGEEGGTKTEELEHTRLYESKSTASSFKEFPEAVEPEFSPGIPSSTTLATQSTGKLISAAENTPPTADATNATPKSALDIEHTASPEFSSTSPTGQKSFSVALPHTPYSQDKMTAVLENGVYVRRPISGLKRPHDEQDEVEKRQRSSEAPADEDIERQNDTEMTTIPNTHEMSQEIARSTEPSRLEETGISDESDFEIPVIDTGSSSDEEPL